MDIVNEDRDLASEVVALLGRELKVAKDRLLKLESRSQAEQEKNLEYKARAEEAEDAVEAFKKKVEELKGENQRLNNEIDEMKDNKIGIKKEIEGAADLGAQAIEKSDASVSTAVDAENEGESMSTNHIHELEKALETYYAKYKVQKAAKTQWREAYHGVEAELRTSEERNSLIENERAKMEIQLKASLPTTHTPIESKKLHRQLMEELEKYMAKLPIPIQRENRPHYSEIHPVLYKGHNLKAYLASDAKLKSYSFNFLYLPGRITHCQPSKVHALAFGPLWSLDSSGQNWKLRNIFEGMPQKSFSLFYSKDYGVFYSGEYCAITLKSIIPDGMAVDPSFNLSTKAVAEASVAECSDKKRGQLRWLVEGLDGLYASKQLKVDVLGLQFVGWDSKVYNYMRSRFEKSTKHTDSVFPDIKQPPMKKRKT